MSDLTVVIPTIGRPEFLRTALQSVRNQIARELIAEVIVSENNNDRRSEDVLQEFPELPIRFIFRSPTLPMTDHLLSTFREARTTYIAILNDDDWWSSNHVAEGMAALQSNPEAAGYVSASLFVADEASAQPAGIGRSNALWLLAGMPSWLNIWTIDAPTMLALGWAYTPFHCSTLLARTSKVREALKALERATYPTHTLDRMLFCYLVLHGPFCYNPVADSFVRWHPFNWINSVTRADVFAMLRATSVIIERLAAERGWDIKQLWQDALARMPLSIEAEVLDRLHEAHTAAELQSCGFKRFFHVRPKPSVKALRNIVTHGKHLLLGR